MNQIFKMMAIALLLPIAQANAQITSGSGSSSSSTPPDKEIFISIRDSIIASVDMQGKPIFTQTAINYIMNQYEVIDFQQAFPTARFRSMRSIYKMKVNDLALPQTLVTNYPHLFSRWETVPQLQPAFTPSDYSNIAGFRNTGYLEYINARDAWDVSRGSSNIVIGVHDWQLDVTHPELASKIAFVTNNLNVNSDHGTSTSGVLVGLTNNGNVNPPHGYYPSIGFNCRIDFTGCTGGFAGSCTGMLATSQRGRRIINMSAAGDCGSDTLFQSPWYKSASQDEYRAIYEEGTLVVAGAGNSNGQAANNYCYPASYDYVFSVSGVGWNNPYSGSLDTNVAGLHEKVRGDSTTSLQHNPRVDLLAPAYNMDVLQRQPTSYFHGASSGTSNAAPLVAGTAGLILAEDSCYTPYQLEYILKTSANGSILSLSENLKYAGGLGTGALDAGKALAMVDSANTGSNPSIPKITCNNTATQTLFIEGIDINTLCVPGYSSNNVKPKLTPIIKHGTPPYKYKWEGMAFNMVTLNSDTSSSPEITNASTFGNGLSEAHLRLTVYDNSAVQKVAAREFHFTLSRDTNTFKYDLVSRDGWMDMTDQPNLMDTLDPRDFNFFMSPDLWNRQTAAYNPEHQKAEYTSTDSNYAFVRIRNVGCKPYNSSTAPHYVKLYWTVASTGEHWANDWDGTTSPSLGGELTSGSGIPIKTLNPGDTMIVRKGWRPVNPAGYGTGDLNVCLLSRIVNASNNAGYEVNGPVITNVRQNNNIATRNLWVGDLYPGNVKAKTRMMIANASAEAQTFDIQFINDKSINRHFAGNFSAVGYVTLYLGELYDVWITAGGLGTYLSRNADAKTVVMDGSQTLELLNIPLAAHAKYLIDVEFSLHTGITIPNYTFDFHLRQFEVEDSKRARDVYGSLSFRLNTRAEVPGRKAINEDVLGGTAKALFHIYPNPAKDHLTIFCQSEEVIADVSITDIVGRTLLRARDQYFSNSAIDVPVSNLPPGVYIVEISNGKGLRHRQKFVKE